MNKIFGLNIILLFAIGSTFASAGQMTLSTYYPAPFGAYDRLRLVPRGNIPDTPCAIGTLYVEEVAGNFDLLRFCNDDGMDAGVWGPIPGVWKEGDDGGTPAAPLVSLTNNDPALRLGVGTDTPEVKFHIIGAVPINVDWSDTGAAGIDQWDDLVIEGDDPVFTLIGKDSTTLEAGIKMVEVNDGGQYNDVWAITRRTSGAANSEFSINYHTRADVSNKWFFLSKQMLTILPSGNVGISDYSPDALLEVSASGGSNDLLKLSSVDDNDGDILTVKNNGNVGIGTTSPAAILDVFGEINTSTVYQIGSNPVLSVNGTSTTLVGIGAGENNTGTRIVAIGPNAARGNSSSDIIAIGVKAGYYNAGEDNIFIGDDAGANNTTGAFNTFVGESAGEENTIGSYNTFLGDDSGVINTTGSRNVFIGRSAGDINSTGSTNTFVGAGAGYSNVSGNGNVFLGKDAGGIETGSNKLYIDNTNNANPLIYGEFDTDIVRINGSLDITGNISKGTGTFVIDHPLHPREKILRHSLVESPQMMNIYSGMAVLDDKGEAVVQLPDYFEALNSEIRYQLTPIGSWASLYIKTEVDNNQFVIGGGVAAMKVSWQITGVRNDAYALKHPIIVEEDKIFDHSDQMMRRGQCIHDEACE